MSPPKFFNMPFHLAKWFLSLQFETKQKYKSETEQKFKLQTAFLEPGLISTLVYPGYKRGQKQFLIFQSHCLNTSACLHSCIPNEQYFYNIQ